MSLNRKASTESRGSSSSEEADGEALAETPAPPGTKIQATHFLEEKFGIEIFIFQLRKVEQYLNVEIVVAAVEAARP